MRQLEDALDQRGGRAGELVEQQVVRGAEQLGRGGGDILRLELGRSRWEMRARLEEDRVEQRLGWQGDGGEMAGRWWEDGAEIVGRL